MLGVGSSMVSCVVAVLLVQTTRCVQALLGLLQVQHGALRSLGAGAAEVAARRGQPRGVLRGAADGHAAGLLGVVSVDRTEMKSGKGVSKPTIVVYVRVEEYSRQS